MTYKRSRNKESRKRWIEVLHENSQKAKELGWTRERMTSNGRKASTRRIKK